LLPPIAIRVSQLIAGDGCRQHPGVAVLEAHVLALGIAELIESPSKGIDGRQVFEGQDPDEDHFSCLLRAGRVRPRSRAAEQRDENRGVSLPDTSRASDRKDSTAQ
jgi:hypothetical protein